MKKNSTVYKLKSKAYYSSPNRQRLLPMWRTKEKKILLMNIALVTYMSDRNPEEKRERNGGKGVWISHKHIHIEFLVTRWWRSLGRWQNLLESGLLGLGYLKVFYSNTTFSFFSAFWLSVTSQPCASVTIPSQPWRNILSQMISHYKPLLP